MHVLSRFESPSKARVTRPTIEMQSEREKSIYYSRTSDIRIVNSDERACTKIIREDINTLGVKTN